MEKIFLTTKKFNSKWENIIKNIIFIVKDSINNYFQTVFEGKQFQNEIDTNLGKIDVIQSKIPFDFIENQEIPEDKIKEINNILNNEIVNFSFLFLEKREKLPLIENFLNNKEKAFNKIADDKIIELMSQFFYFEDKIPFNSDNFNR